MNNVGNHIDAMVAILHSNFLKDIQKGSLREKLIDELIELKAYLSSNNPVLVGNKIIDSKHLNVKTIKSIRVKDDRIKLLRLWKSIVEEIRHELNKY